MTQVVDLYGVFLPVIGLLAVVAFPLFTMLSRLLAAAGLYRHVWHRPLFDLGLYVSLLGLLDLVLRWIHP